MTVFTSGDESLSSTVYRVTTVQFAPVASVAAHVEETTFGFPAASRSPARVSLIVPFTRPGESAELVLVTTIVQFRTAPTRTGSGAQFFVTLTPGWNRFVLSVAVAVSELAKTPVPAV